MKNIFLGLLLLLFTVTTFAQFSGGGGGGATVGAENGSAIFATSGQQNLSTTVVDINQSTFTLPSAGTWDVTYTAHIFSVNNASISIFITNTSNTLVTNSVGNGNEASASQMFLPITKTVTIITTGATNYKLRGFISGAGTGGVLANDLALRSNTINWTKISGFLPVQYPKDNGGIVFGNGTNQTQDATNLFYNDVSKRLGIGTNVPSNNFTIAVPNASIRLNETSNNQNYWVNRFTNRAVVASSDALELRTGSADGVNGALTTIDNSGNITQFGATKITTGTNGLRLPITSASANVAGGAIGVDVNGDVVKIANPSIPTLVGSNGVIAGTAGLVPAPTATDNTKFLKGDGTWATAGGATVPFVNGGIVFGNGTTQVQDATNFFIDNTNKRIGIGTNVPAERLDIVGSGTGGSSALKISNFGGGVGWGIKLLPLNNGGDYIRFDRADGNQIGRINNSGATGDDFVLAAQGDLVLGSSYIDRLRIKNNGYVGIGTNTPTALLDVTGGSDEMLKLTGTKTTLKINSNNDNPEFVFSRTGGVVGNFGRVDFRFDNAAAGGSLNNVFNFEGGLKIPITSSTPDATGSPIGVNSNGEIVKIANTAAAVLGAYAQGRWYQQGNNVLLASANWVPVAGYTVQGLTLTTATGASPRWTVNETGTYMIQTGLSCQPDATDVQTGMAIVKNLGEVVAANYFVSKGVGWQPPLTTVGIEIDMVAGDTFDIIYTNVKIMDGGGPEVTKIKRVR